VNVISRFNVGVKYFIIFAKNNIMKLTENFSLSEFNCKSGEAMTPEVFDNIKELAKNMQVLRNHIGKPIQITSGYRSPKHNKKIGGAKASKHILGQACDFKVSGVTPAEVIKSIEVLIMSGKMKEGGVGIYPTWVHYDIRGTKSRW
jgi:uncharacterized protein YcbK (DUF882 family)